MTPEQDAHCETVIRWFSQRLRAKYAKGQQEHGGNMWEKRGMLRHAQEEADDLENYLTTVADQLCPTCYQKVMGQEEHPDAHAVARSLLD